MPHHKISVMQINLVRHGLLCKGLWGQIAIFLFNRAWIQDYYYILFLVFSFLYQTKQFPSIISQKARHWILFILFSGHAFSTSYLLHFPLLDSSQFGNNWESVVSKTVPCQCQHPRVKHMLPTALLQCITAWDLPSFVTISYYGSIICHGTIRHLRKSNRARSFPIL